MVIWNTESPLLAEILLPSSASSDNQRKQDLSRIGIRQQKWNADSNFDNKEENVKIKNSNNRLKSIRNASTCSRKITSKHFSGNYLLLSSLSTPKHRTEGIVRLLLATSMICHCWILSGAGVVPTSGSMEVSATRRPTRLSSSPESGEVFVPDYNLQLKVLQNIKRSLEYYSSITARNLLKKAAQTNKNNKSGENVSNHFNDENRINSEDVVDMKPKTEHLHRFDTEDLENIEDRSENFIAQKNSNSREIDNVGLIGNGSNVFGNFMRVRVGLRETNGENLETSNDGLHDANITDNSGESQYKFHDNTANKVENLREATTSHPSIILSSSEITSSATPGYHNVNVDVNEIESDMSASSSKRRLRSASTQVAYSNTNSPHHRHSHRHHHLRRRRKGCPPLHGKGQLLCPSRNSHRYDVCVTREQLCNHIEDCPNGEDEDPSQCFFYKPLDDHLKTLSHAVLLLAESVMSEQQHRHSKSSNRAGDL